MRRYIIPLILITASFSLASCNFNVEMPKGYALVYGVSLYNSSENEGVSPNLTYTDNDAVDVANMLSSADYEVLLRTEGNSADGPDYDTPEPPTKEQLLIDIASLSTINEDATFIFYFSGHGCYTATQSVDEPSSQQYGDEWILPLGSFDGTSWHLDLAISDDELREFLKKIPAKKKIIIMDSCHSGGFIGDSADVDGVPGDYTGELDTGLFSEAFNLYLRFPDSTGADIPADEAIVLSAAGEQESSWEAGGYGHGIFTYFFLEAATNGDLDEDGYITLLEAYAYTVAGIEQYWNPLGSSSSFHPHISGGPVDFLLFKADP
ncbi:MAG: caspase family protein [Spirochaetales bacterium]|nr:caspase family protein [Spirochaetales bacterium]